MNNFAGTPPQNHCRERLTPHPDPPAVSHTAGAKSAKKCSYIKSRVPFSMSLILPFSFLKWPWQYLSWKIGRKGMSPILGHWLAFLLCGRYSLQYFVTNCMIIWRLRDWCQRKKRVSKKIKGAKDQLLIEKMILRNRKRRLTGLRMACIYTTRRHMI